MRVDEMPAHAYGLRKATTLDNGQEKLQHLMKNSNIYPKKDLPKKGDLYHTNQRRECLEREQSAMLNTTDLSNNKKIRNYLLYLPTWNGGHRNS